MVLNNDLQRNIIKDYFNFLDINQLVQKYGLCHESIRKVINENCKKDIQPKERHYKVISNNGLSVTYDDINMDRLYIESGKVDNKLIKELIETIKKCH